MKNIKKYENDKRVVEFTDVNNDVNIKVILRNHKYIINLNSGNKESKIFETLNVKNALDYFNDLCISFTKKIK